MKISSKKQIDLIISYIYNQCDYIDNEIQERNDYFNNRRIKKDEFDLIEDIVLNVRQKEIHRIYRDIYHLLRLQTMNEKGDTKPP